MIFTCFILLYKVCLFTIYIYLFMFIFMKCNSDNLYDIQSYYPTKNHHAKSKGHQVNVPVIVPMDIIGYTFTSYTSYFSFHSPFTTIRCITLTMTVIRYQILEIRNQVRLVIYGISLPKYLTNYTS